MVHVTVMPPFDREFFAGRSRFDFSADNLFAVVAALGREAPGFGDVAGVRGQFAVDGVIEPDWSRPVGADSEIILIARVGGG